MHIIKKKLFVKSSVNALGHKSLGNKRQKRKDTSAANFMTSQNNIVFPPSLSLHYLLTSPPPPPPSLSPLPTV